MHGPEQFLVELFAIFVAAKVLGEVFERLRLPGVLGEILAGVGLGPYALNWIAPSDTIYSVAEVGAIFVLFSAGLETSPQALIRVGRKSLLVAVAGVVAPFILGFAYMKIRGDATTEAVFVGAAMVATSVGITARVLADMHVLATRTAQIILGAAVFDDILGMILLAVVAGIASPGGLHWLHLGILIGEAAAFALFMIFVAPPIVRRMQPRMEQLSSQNASLIVAGSEDRYGCDYWRLLCRPGFRRLCSRMEPAAAGLGNHGVPRALLLFRYWRTTQPAIVQ